MRRNDVFPEVEAALGRVRPGQAMRLISRWSRTCRVLAAAQLARPAQVPSWVWQLDTDDADDVLRCLVRSAQGGDQVAVLTTLACLRPGTRSLARRVRVSTDEVVAELVTVILTFPLERRTSVVGQLLLDTRQRIVRAAARDVPRGDTRLLLDEVEAPGELGAGQRIAEQVSDVVYGMWKVGELSADAARLVLSTRLWGESVLTEANRLGVDRKAALARRSRAEARITQALAR